MAQKIKSTNVTEADVLQKIKVLEQEISQKQEDLEELEGVLHLIRLGFEVNFNEEVTE